MGPLPLALTLGEPAGIGPEVALQAWLKRGERKLPPFIVLGDADFLARLADDFGWPVAIVETAPERAAEVFDVALPVMPLDMAVVGEPGRPNASDAPAVIESIRRSVDLVMTERACAMVTSPLSKAPLIRAGFQHPGHTEYLGALAQEHTGAKHRPVMMLWSDELSVVPVTIHIPLSEVPRALTSDLIVETARIVAHDLRTRFLIREPRLAFCGLNPHAGEDGALGSEDADIVAPAVERLIAEGIQASGPYPADTMFHPAARQRYDVAIAMYHDQGLIPIKTLAFDKGVNVTLGLPFVRTSPDHGTAFDIAGQGVADPTSTIHALKLAARLAAVPR